MIRVKFIWGEDEERGGEGWIPAAQPDFNANVSGGGIAHDVVEHANLKDGSVEGEAQAFGAVLYGRAMSGWFSQQIHMNRDPVWHMAASFSGVLRNLFDAERREPMLQAPKGGIRRLDDEDAEEIIRETTAKASQMALQEIGAEYEYRDNDDKALLFDFLASVRANLPRHLRVGYRKCRDRFQASSCDVADLYDQITKEVNQHSHRHVYTEGDELTVAIKPGRLNFELRYTSILGE